MVSEYSFFQSERCTFLAIFLVSSLTLFLENKHIGFKQNSLLLQSIKTKAYPDLHWDFQQVHRFIQRHQPEMHMNAVSHLVQHPASVPKNSSSTVFTMDPNHFPSLRANNAHRTLWVIPGADGNCGWRDNYVCKFWQSVRCNMFGGFQNVRVANRDKVVNFSHPDDIVVLAYRPRRMLDHETPPPDLAFLIQWRDKNAPRLRIGVLHVANELRRSNWQWYTDADFVLRNYWLPGSRFPPHVAYVPLHFQMPSICTPEFPSLSPNIECSCGGLQLQIASKRPYLYSFSGSLRRGRKAMLHAFGNSSLANRGYISVAESFGGDGKVRHLRSILNSTFVLAPCGNVMETHRIYEALALGAVPVIERCSDEHIGENLDSFFPYHELIVDSTKGMIQFVRRYTSNPTEQNALQLRVLTWWREYSRQTTYNITRVITTDVARSSRWSP